MLALARGFTIVEVMITLVVLGVLIMFGAPEFAAFLQNQKTRAAADAVLSGLQTARAEAVQRNKAVQFKLTAVPSSSWTVSESVGGAVIQTRSADEGNTGQIAVAAVDIGGNAVTTVTFSPIGGVTSNADATAALRTINLTNPMAVATNARAYRLLISGGGSLRMCDPTVAVANDPRFCPATY